MSADILAKHCARRLADIVPTFKIYADNKVHGANMGSIWGQQDPVGPHVGPMNFVIWIAAFLKDPPQ